MRQILIKNFKKRQLLDWKKDNALDFELKNFGHIRFWKILACKDHVLVHFTPRKRDILHFWCFFESMILKWIFSNRNRFRFRGFLARQICNSEKNTFKVVLNRSSFHLKKTQHVSFSVKVLQPLRDELTCGSFQLYIWWLNLQQTLSFTFVP